MQRFTADDGETIHLTLSGDGPPLVLLHGWTSTHRDWNPFAAAFGARHRVFRWDARGHSGHPLHASTPVRVERMARDLQNLLDHFELDRVTIAGHSMGALTLWQYLRDFGQRRLARLIFIDQSPRLLTGDGWTHGICGDFDASRNAGLLDALRADFAEAVLRLVAFGDNARARAAYLENGPALHTARQRLAALDPQPLIDCWQSLTAADYRDVLPAIARPTLLVYGGASNFYSAATAAYVRDAIRGARLHLYAGADHAPHLAERERFVADVLDFIAAR